MAINFPDSPTLNETVLQADRAWQWDGEKWKSTGTTSSSTVGASVIFEGSTDDAFETTLAATDPTADRTITLKNASGTVAFTSDIPTVAGVYAPLESPAFTGTLTATAFAGPLTGDVTGNCSGTAGSATGNAATATALATARDIGGVSFDGTGNINLPGVNATGNQNTSGTAATVTGAAQTAITSVGTLTSLTVSGGLVAPLQINAQTGTTYTFVLGDAGKLVTSSNASAQTLTVPPNSSVAYTVGTQILVTQVGTGRLTLAEGSGVTINSGDSMKSLSDQYCLASLIKTATDTWLLMGNLQA